MTRAFIKCHLSDKFIIITELNIPLFKLFPRGVFIIFKSAIRQLKIIGKYDIEIIYIRRFLKFMSRNQSFLGRIIEEQRNIDQIST